MASKQGTLCSYAGCANKARRRGVCDSHAGAPVLEPMLVFGDAHRPYHDVRAWDLMLEVGEVFKPHHIVCMGDLLDCYSVSSHSKDPRRTLRLKEEIEDGRKALDDIDALGAVEKRFVAGNHSYRLERYLCDKAPELFEFMDIPSLLQLEERGWQYTPYKHDTKLGEVRFTHDVGASGRNAAFRALDMYQHSIITGHTHRMQFLVEGNSAGDSTRLSAQFGWLGDVNQIDYMHRAKCLKDWSLGFGWGYFNPKSGICYLTPVPIIKDGDTYTAVVNGRLFEG